MPNLNFAEALNGHYKKEICYETDEESDCDSHGFSVD